MRFAVISDLHANLEALDAVLSDIEKQKVDEIICLGDVVGYGANPNECIDTVRNACAITLLGNHDSAAIGMLSTQNFNIHAKIAIEWTSENLGPDSRTFLGNLPLRENRHSHTFAHATPYEPNMWHYITSLEEAAFNFHFFDTQFCFVGHTHIPLIIVVTGGRELYVHQDDRIDLSGLHEGRFLINVGSVGQPRDHDPRSCYGILDSDQKWFRFRRVKYDIDACQAKMRKTWMPDFLITRLREGR